ncbi:hsp90-like protein [Coprinopsis cinerea okayama7|uniref:Hsp90 chaperone protein kinase-targeting subunit n=1 Tax=Coprinopsis cinerea (strain Okayama-7 / 130 / ATCC MYA-4618 / FGSC 9003) TaxID=240176 RepID=A8NQ43_COPC7|nr:hsp90-like protein [Coprinopsis cinerea okayama7\|eukprot:XP_001835477.1 hsp90-like protein [Coprinopsis cinerea okayama7\
MPLNYSKWDNLELSDDSDIEGHPNVDHKSLVRWKQRDIHEKREARKQKIAHLQAQIACNKVLLPRITEIAKTLADPNASTPAPAYFNNLVEQLEKNPSKDCPPGNNPDKIEQTYDGMVLSLLQRVSQDAKNKLKELNLAESEKEERLSKELVEQMETHVKQLGEVIERDQKEVEEEIREQKKKITSEDIREGWETKYVPPKPEPPPVPTTKVDKPKSKGKEKVTEFEVLNPAGVAAATAAESADDDDDDDDEGLPKMTPSLVEFSKIPLGDYERSFKFIQDHRDVYVPGASDALLVAAFEAEGQGKHKYAKKCVHQSLLLQYCEKLGPNGVGMFFKKMIAGDQRAQKVFSDDVESTYNHLVTRVKISKEEQAQEGAGREQIQLVAENPDTVISFNVPDGPPPENLVLEGEGVEDLDIEQVRKALQYRWDVFQAFPKELQEALKVGELTAVNKVLGDMEVDEAEAIVNALDSAGILNFAEGGIRDETGGEGSGSGGGQ